MRSQRLVACHKTGAGNGLVLPDPGLVQLVIMKGSHAADQQAAVAVRTQLQIGLVQKPGRGQAIKPIVDALGQACIHFTGLRRIVIVEKNDVQIRGITQLFTAQFAVAYDGKFCIWPMPRFELSPNKGQADVQYQIG